MLRTMEDEMKIVGFRIPQKLNKKITHLAIEAGMAKQYVITLALMLLVEVAESPEKFNSCLRELEASNPELYEEIKAIVEAAKNAEW